MEIIAIYTVVNTFSLKGGDQLTQNTIDYLKKMDIKSIRTSHCTQFDALVQFADAFGSKPFASGMTIEL